MSCRNDDGFFDHCRGEGNSGPKKVWRKNDQISIGGRYSMSHSVANWPLMMKKQILSGRVDARWTFLHTAVKFWPFGSPSRVNEMLVDPQRADLLTSWLFFVCPRI